MSKANSNSSICSSGAGCAVFDVVVSVVVVVVGLVAPLLAVLLVLLLLLGNNSTRNANELIRS